MKYLSLYKTSSEHSADNSRLVPNISLITDEKKLILTNENNIDTTFTEVDIIDTFDDIINRFPSRKSTSMPGLKIYGDNTDQSKAKNIKLFNDAVHWGFNNTWDDYDLHVDALLIDNIIMDKYDGNYKYYIHAYKLITSGKIKYYIDIYKNITSSITSNDEKIKILNISKDGSVKFYGYNIFPSPLETAMPGLNIYTDNTDKSKEKNIKLFNAAQEWRKDHISYKGWSDTNQGIEINVDALIIDNKTIDKYDRNFYYYIDIYKDHIILTETGGLEILTISSDGSVRQINPIPIDSTTTII